MQYNFLKKLTVCSLIFAFLSPNAAYADKIEATATEEEEQLEKTSDNNIYAVEQRDALKQYAIDIFHDSALVFFYKTAGTYNPGTLEVEEPVTGRLSIKEAETAAHDYDDEHEGEDPGDPDGNPRGAWYGFDGVTNRIVIFNRSNADVLMTATSTPAEITTGTDEYTGITPKNETAKINLFLNGDDLKDQRSLEPQIIDTGGEEPETVYPILSYAYQQRVFDVTGTHTIGGGTEDELQLTLAYDPQRIKDAMATDAATGSDTAQNASGWTDDWETYLLFGEAFSTKEDDTFGGRFSANADFYNQENPITPVLQEDVDDGNGHVTKANNSTMIRGWAKIDEKGKESDNNYLGYALVYFDISGEPFNEDSRKLKSYEEYKNCNESVISEKTSLIGKITLTFSSVEDLED